MCLKRNTTIDSLYVKFTLFLAVLFVIVIGTYVGTNVDAAYIYIYLWYASFVTLTIEAINSSRGVMNV